MQAAVQLDIVRVFLFHNIYYPAEELSYNA